MASVSTHHRRVHAKRRWTDEETNLLGTLYNQYKDTHNLPEIARLYRGRILDQHGYAAVLTRLSSLRSRSLHIHTVSQVVQAPEIPANVPQAPILPVAPQITTRALSNIVMRMYTCGQANDLEQFMEEFKSLNRFYVNQINNVHNEVQEAEQEVMTLHVMAQLQNRDQ